MARILGLLVTIGALCLAGCGGDSTAPIGPTPPLIRPVQFAPGVTVQIEQQALLANYDTSPIGSPLGVSVDPQTGRRLVLVGGGISGGAIFDLDSDLSEPIWIGESEIPGAMFTDLADLGDGQLALTSTSDGYLLDLETGAIAPHFCFEPGWWEPIGQDPVQISFGVAHDAQAGLLYAQPRTVEEGGIGAVTESFIASYDEAGGADLRWWSIDDLAFTAGGMVVLESGETTKLLLGSLTFLYQFDTETAELTPIADLQQAEIFNVGGLALDREAGTLLVADPSSNRVVELELETLEL